MPTSKKTTPKKAPATKTKTARKRRTTKKTSSNEMVSSMDKEQLVSGLKQTMKDVGKLPGIFLAPVIAYVSSKYDSIPESRRKKLEEIIASSKEQGGSVLSKLKDRFMDRFNDAKETVTQDTEKKPTKKRAARKRSAARSTSKTAATKTKTPRKSTTTKTSTRKTARKSTTKKASE